MLAPLDMLWDKIPPMEDFHSNKQTQVVDSETTISDGIITPFSTINAKVGHSE